MTDYLSHLATRNLGLNPGEMIQPRLASRFEPPPEARGVQFSHSFSLEIDEPHAADKVTDGSPLAAPAPRQLSVVPVEPQPPSRQVQVDTMEPKITPPYAHSPLLSAAPSASLPEETRSRPPASLLLDTVETARPTISTMPVMKPASLKAATELDRHPLSQPVETIGRARPILPRPQRASTTSVHPSNVPLASPAELLPIVLPSQNTQPIPQPAPTIHITIGRIEVRALTPPPPPPKRSATPTPKLSLDEYLERRKSQR